MLIKILWINFDLLFSDALLADLQNTISPGSPTPRDIGSSTSGYGSLNGPRRDLNHGDYGQTRQVSSEKIHSIHRTQSPASVSMQEKTLSVINNKSFDSNLPEVIRNDK